MKFITKRFDKHDPDHKKDLKEAMEYYNKVIEDGHPYVCLFFSNNWASEGYWVENIKPNEATISAQNGIIIKEYDIRVIRDKKIEEIII